MSDTEISRAQMRAATAPVTEDVLQAFEKSTAAKHVMVKRIIHALRGAWQTVFEREERIADLELAGETKGREDEHAVLVVVHADGWCAVYADDSVQVARLELKPWDSEDETQWPELLTDGKRWRFAHLLEGKLRLECYPHFLSRPNVVSEEAVARAILWHKRCTVADKMAELAALRLASKKS